MAVEMTDNGYMSGMSLPEVVVEVRLHADRLSDAPRVIYWTDPTDPPRVMHIEDESTSLVAEYVLASITEGRADYIFERFT